MNFNDNVSYLCIQFDFRCIKNGIEINNLKAVIYINLWVNGRSGDRIVVADMAPHPAKADALNAAELLRDPSHVRAMPEDELCSLFDQAGLRTPQINHYRMEGELEDLLSRSFPNEGDANRLRKIYADSIASDSLDLNTRQENGKIYYSLPVAVLVAQKEQLAISRWQLAKSPA